MEEKVGNEIHKELKGDFNYISKVKIKNDLKENPSVYKVSGRNICFG